MLALVRTGRLGRSTTSSALESQRKAFERIRATSANTLRIQGKKMNARWLRQFMDYDPLPIFKQIKVPLLAIMGSHDMQVLSVRLNHIPVSL